MFHPTRRSLVRPYGSDLLPHVSQAASYVPHTDTENISAAFAAMVLTSTSACGENLNQADHPPLTCETAGVGVRNFIPGSNDPPVLIVIAKNSTAVRGVGPTQLNPPIDRLARLCETGHSAAMPSPVYSAPVQPRYPPRNALIIPPSAVQIRTPSSGQAHRKPYANRADPTMTDYLEKIPAHLVMRNGGGNGPMRLNPYAPRGQPRSRCDLVTPEQSRRIIGERFEHRPYHEWRHEELERRRVYNERRRSERDYDPADTPDSAIDVSGGVDPVNGFEDEEENGAHADEAVDEFADEAIDSTFDRNATTIATDCNCGRKLRNHNADDEAAAEPAPPFDWASLREPTTPEEVARRRRDYGFAGFDVEVRVDKPDFHHQRHGHWIGGPLCGDVYNCFEKYTKCRD